MAFFWQIKRTIAAATKPNELYFFFRLPPRTVDLIFTLYLSPFSVLDITNIPVSHVFMRH